jgi:hypothetical protein
MEITAIIYRVQLLVHALAALLAYGFYWAVVFRRGIPSWENSLGQRYLIFHRITSISAILSVSLFLVGRVLLDWKPIVSPYFSYSLFIILMSYLALLKAEIGFSLLKSDAKNLFHYLLRQKLFHGFILLIMILGAVAFVEKQWKFFVMGFVLIPTLFGIQVFFFNKDSRNQSDAFRARRRYFWFCLLTSGQAYTVNLLGGGPMANIDYTLFKFFNDRLVHLFVGIDVFCILVAYFILRDSFFEERLQKG